MPLFVGDYLRDTGHLTTVEHGAYLLLIMQAWTRKGFLPYDENRLRVMAKMGAREWKRSRDTILGLFYKDEQSGGYRNRRVDTELKNAQSNNQQRKDAGTASAKARVLQRAEQKKPEDVKPQTGDDVQPPTQDLGLTQAKPTDSQQTDQDAENKENDGNGRLPFVGLPLERNARPSPSPSPSPKEEENPPPTPPSGGSRARGDEIDEEFERLFWPLYPLKVDKGHAVRAFRTARKKAPLGTIIAGLKRYKFSHERDKQPYASTWLNGERWADEQATIGLRCEGRPPPSIVAPAYDGGL